MYKNLLSLALEDFNLTFDIIKYMTKKEFEEHISRPYKCTQLLISQDILLWALCQNELPLKDNKKVTFSDKKYIYLF